MTTSVQNRGRTTAVAAATVLALLAAGCTSSTDQAGTSSSAGSECRCLDIGEFGGVRRSGFRSRHRNRLDLLR